MRYGMEPSTDPPKVTTTDPPKVTNLEHIIIHQKRMGAILRQLESGGEVILRSIPLQPTSSTKMTSLPRVRTHTHDDGVIEILSDDEDDVQVRRPAKRSKFNDDDDDVQVRRPAKRSKFNDDDDDIIVVPPPAEMKIPDIAKKMPTNVGNIDDDDDDEIKIVGRTGNNSLSDFPHARCDCVEFPIANDPLKHCTKCYCFVCDKLASSCTEWTNHCHANYDDARWRTLREQKKKGVTSTPTPPAVASPVTTTVPTVRLPVPMVVDLDRRPPVCPPVCPAVSRRGAPKQNLRTKQANCPRCALLRLSLKIKGYGCRKHRCREQIMSKLAGKTFGITTYGPSAGQPCPKCIELGDYCANHVDQQPRHNVAYHNYVHNGNIHNGNIHNGNIIGSNNGTVFGNMSRLLVDSVAEVRKLF